MEPELLKTKELPLLLNMSANKASELLAKHKIKPIDFGPGRGNGLRWLTREVRRWQTHYMLRLKKRQEFQSADEHMPQDAYSEGQRTNFTMKCMERGPSRTDWHGPFLLWELSVWRSGIGKAVKSVGSLLEQPFHVQA